MQHKVKVTVIDKKLYPELQAQYCADPQAGPCPCYQVGDEFLFERYGAADDFWHMGLRTVLSAGDVTHTAGGPHFPHCSEAWDAISRYIYAGLQGGSIMRGWMKDERVMIACCSDGTRPVVFKIERLDYKALYFTGICGHEAQKKLGDALAAVDGVSSVIFREDFAEVFLDRDLPDACLKEAAEQLDGCRVTRID